MFRLGDPLTRYTSKSKSLSSKAVKGSIAMSRLTKAIRSRRDARRTRRELEAAIRNASTPSLRDELILVGQRADLR
jgi:hypothetical protein